MKKKYIMPQTIVANIDNAAILAVSDPFATPVDQRPQSDVSGSSTSTPSDNQFTKKYNYNLWEDE